MTAPREGQKSSLVAMLLEAGEENAAVLLACSPLPAQVGATSAFVPPNLIDPTQGLQKILDSITSLQSAGTETIDGVATRKVTGTVPAGRLKEILPDATNPADFTAWIREGGDPVLVRTTINVSAEQSVTVSLSKWNAPVLLIPAPTA